jgi:hypothetical protein
MVSMDYFVNYERGKNIRTQKFPKRDSVANNIWFLHYDAFQICSVAQDYHTGTEVH